MASSFRNVIAARCRQSLMTLNGNNGVGVTDHRSLVADMSLRYSAKSKSPITVSLPVSRLALESKSDLGKFIEAFETDGAHVQAVTRLPDGDQLFFAPERNSFFSRELRHQLKRGQQGYLWMRDGLFPAEDPQTVIVEYSSPNVAKPFHMGHLRSTIVGNFVANIFQVVGHKVIRINYLGDWGTQFGFLIAGLSDSGLNLSEILSLDGEAAIQKLSQIYVAANHRAETDVEFSERAKKSFAQLETGDPVLQEQWRAIRELTIAELQRVYGRLNVVFDHYHGESMYSHDAGQKVVKILSDQKLLQHLDDGRQVVYNNSGQPVVIVKSDGSSLYISRDLAAAMDRQATFHPDRVMYVVEKGQSVHFENVFSILQKAGYDWASHMRHVTFGRIKGMSTRRGSAIFLSDILNEGRDQMIERLATTVNTKVMGDEDQLRVSDVLATTCVIVADLRQKRVRDYEFSWDNALNSKGDSGIKFHYTHARLTSLLEKQNGFNIDFVSELQLRPELSTHLREPEAEQLVFQMARFGEVLRDAYVELEPCGLVSYLFRLCNATSKALKELPVRDQEADISFARLALFAASRATLRQGLKVIGIEPLDKM